MTRLHCGAFVGFHKGKVIIGKPAKKTVIIAIILVLAAALVTACVVGQPKLINPSEPVNTPGVSGTKTPGNTPGGTETPGTTPSASTNEPDNTSVPGNTPDVSAEPDSAHPDSPYAKVKAYVDRHINAHLEQYYADLDINKIIEEAYSNYGGLIDKNIITPDLIRVLFLVWRSNDLGFNDAEESNMQNYIRENGYEPLGSFGEPRTRFICGMIYLGKLANEKGYTTEQYSDLVSDYYNSAYYGEPIHSAELFNKYFSRLIPRTHL